MTRIYVLDTIEASNHRLYAGGQWVNDDRTKCPVCGTLTEESEPKEILIALNHVGRLGFAEYLWNSHSLPIFRQDVVEVWQKAGFGGYKTKPVRVVGWHGAAGRPLPKGIPNYMRIVVTSRVHMSYPRFIAACTQCGSLRHDFELPHTSTQLLKSMQIDETSWDGAEVFGVHASDILCVQRVASVTLEAGFNKSLAFVRLEQYRHWEPYDIRRWDARTYAAYTEGFLIRKPEKLH